MSPRRATLAVYLEVGDKRSFACAVDWPGWSRAGKGEDAAIEALLAYGPRFAPVAEAAGHPLPAALADGRSEAVTVDVVERVTGGAGTEWGVPDIVADLDRRPLTKAQAERGAAFVAAAWAYLDDVAAGAPESLRKGPRGGGRDTSKIVEHVREAERAYGRYLGLTTKAADLALPDGWTSFHDEVLAALRAARSGEPMRPPKGWPPRYAARRIAWHALDHAWEIQDRIV